MISNWKAKVKVKDILGGKLQIRGRPKIPLSLSLSPLFSKPVIYKNQPQKQVSSHTRN